MDVYYCDVLRVAYQHFYQAELARSKTGNDSYRLGLAIADKLIRENHGEILVESQPVHGSAFTIKLPLVN